MRKYRLDLQSPVYAWAPHSEYIRRHGTQGAHTMLVGMNRARHGQYGSPIRMPKNGKRSPWNRDLPCRTTPNNPSKETNLWSRTPQTRGLRNSHLECPLRSSLRRKCALESMCILSITVHFGCLTRKEPISHLTNYEDYCRQTS